MNFLKLSAVWGYYHKFFPKDEPVYQRMPAGTVVYIDGKPVKNAVATFRVRTDIVKCLKRKDMRPIITAGKPGGAISEHYACVMRVSPESKLSTVYLFYIN